jgi:excinuclease ABC subunit C
VGESRRNALLKHFGSVKKIKAATVEEIAGVKGIPKKLARLIHETMRKSSKY